MSIQVSTKSRLFRAVLLSINRIVKYFCTAGVLMVSGLVVIERVVYLDVAMWNKVVGSTIILVVMVYWSIYLVFLWLKDTSDRDKT